MRGELDKKRSYFFLSDFPSIIISKVLVYGVPKLQSLLGAPSNRDNGYDFTEYFWNKGEVTGVIVFQKAFCTQMQGVIWEKEAK